MKFLDPKTGNKVTEADMNAIQRYHFEGGDDLFDEILMKVYGKISYTEVI